MGFFNQPLSEPIPPKDLVSPLKKIENIFGPISLEGISLYYSTKGLYPWEAGAAWGPVIRIHPRFKKKSAWLWGLYERDEIIAHELVHAARHQIEGDQFEEMLAFLTAKSLFRQAIGPLFSSPVVAILLMLAAALMPLFIFFDMPFLGGFIPIITFTSALIYLQKRRSVFNRCRKKWGLEKMLFMSDKEIKSEAQGAHT